jgi:signal transduction histidine kinase
MKRLLSWLRGFFTHLTWAQRFMLASLVILVLGMAGLGWWMGLQIESSVIHQSAAYSALYVSSIVEPNLQEMAAGDTLTPAHQAALDQLLQETALGQHITAVKIWDKQGRIVYATDSANLGLNLPIDSQLASALRGWVAADISNLDKPENIHDRDRGKRRLETYSPVRLTGTNQIIAAVEFYQTVDDLDRAIAAARQRCWLTVGAVTIGMYLLLAGFVRRVSDTLSRQQSELSAQVVRLKDLLAQNHELHERVRRAAERTTALNERFLRRSSAELHDGPAQDLGLALLRLENLEPCTEAAQAPLPPSSQADFGIVQSSLQNALKEIRAISAGMGLPELQDVTLAETVARAVHAHERRTSTQVALSTGELPECVSLPVKITVYRLIQEALTNAFRHAGGADQQVTVTCGEGGLDLAVSDGGPGFDDRATLEGEDHLGLMGMRERVESLGGTFTLRSAPSRGTRVSARLPLEPPQKEDAYDR